MWHLSAQKESAREADAAPSIRCTTCNPLARPHGDCHRPSARRSQRCHHPARCRSPSLPLQSCSSQRSGRAGPASKRPAGIQLTASGPRTALQPAQQGCNKPEATTSFTIASNRLEGSKPALPGPNTVGSLFSIQFHAVEFTGVNARSQILKSHTPILHEQQLLCGQSPGTAPALQTPRPLSPSPPDGTAQIPGTHKESAQLEQS